MRCILLLTPLLCLPTPARPAEPTFTPQQMEFFEAKVRPLLVERCQGCHGEKKQQASLRLDSREAILQGGDTGPAVDLKAPAKSLLLARLHEKDESLRMPPKGPLPPAEVEVLTQWVALGAPYPAKASGVTRVDPRTHWAFQPVAGVKVPAVRDASRVANPIDAFVLQGLEARNLTLAPPADRRTLIRRLYFDLIGLPPTQAQVDAFLLDPRPDATRQLIETLLASPQYGERWARHWLDLARYSDTKGYVFQEDRNYPYAYTYREWVVRSLNEDLPYDQFILQQLAADRLQTPGGDNRSLAAMGFLTVGRRFINNIHDIIDDRIDTVTRTFMGLTVTCARCHDHKFDPIPIKDYYSLYGVFASSVEPGELPLIGEPAQGAEYARFQAEVQRREQARDQFVQARHAEKLKQLSEARQIAAHLQSVRDLLGQPDNKLNQIARERDQAREALVRWRALVQSPAGSEGYAVFAFLAELAKVPDAEFAQLAPQRVGQVIAAGGKLDAALLEALTDRRFERFSEVAGIYADYLAGSLTAATPTPSQRVARTLLQSPQGPLGIAVSSPSPLFDRADRDRLAELQRQIDAFKAASPAAPPRAMVMVDAPQPNNPYVFVRGNPGNRGPSVPRQFLQVVAGERRAPFTQGSGRLEMARAIADPANPLTARVLVNRVWLNHFGTGLVRTPSDFGVRSEAPTHPQLLDYLAGHFVREGWSIKALHRLILNSETYQQSSDCSEELLRADPENRLLARANRRRLDFESLRDSLLHVSGALESRVGGRSVDLFGEPFTARRTLYGFIDRQNLPGTFRAFDFASPDTHSPQRFNTTVPQQALFLLNSPFVVEQARRLAARPEIAGAGGDSQRVAALYRQVYGREARPRELEMATRFLSSPAPVVEEQTPPGKTWQYGTGRWNPTANRLERFTPLPHFTQGQWRGGPQLPDAKLGWALLTARGGHPGTSPDFLVSRRWTSPGDGMVRVEGLLEHGVAQGDGVRGRVVSSERGVLGSWEVHHGKVTTSVPPTPVLQGEILDCVVDCRETLDSDSFAWAPVIEWTAGRETRTFDAARDFRGPPEAPKAPITPLERLAQVLLVSNEFAFVD